MRRKVWALAVATALATTLFATTAAADHWEIADINGQGMGGPLVANNGAKIHRTEKGVTASVTMPTPAPGNYALPPASAVSNDEHGSPAAFSLWVFIFFNPEACASDLCGPGDLANPVVVGAGYNAGGHLASGPNLTISGQVNAQSQAFGPRFPVGHEFVGELVPVCPATLAGACIETIGQALDMDDITIAGAEIHLAVAPHGKLDSSKMPEQIGTPAGSPAFWWVALYN